MDETPLVEAARGGSERAFAVLVRTHERSLYATALSLVGSSWDASDAVQDTFLEAYANIAALRDAAKFKPWLTRILINKCYGTLGKRRHVELTDEPPDRAAHQFVGTEAQLDLFRAVRALDEDHRTVIALRYYQDLKVEEIATILDCPAGTVKSRINRALGRLSAALGRHSQLEVT